MFHLFLCSLVYIDRRSFEHYALHRQQQQKKTVALLDYDYEQ